MNRIHTASMEVATRTSTVTLLEELSVVLHTAAQDSALQGIIIATTNQPNTSADTAPQTQFKSPTSLQSLATVLKLAQTAGQQLRTLNIPSIVILSHPGSIYLMSLAMAATYCISSNNKGVQLAFSETKHGLHPNMLSTQQVIRRMGTASAMHYLLSGETLSAAKALHLGLLDACAAETELHTTATDLLISKPPGKQAEFTQRLRTLSPFRKTLNFDLHDKVHSLGKQTDYPAPYALLRLWEQYGLDSSTDTQHAYTESINHLSQTQQAVNLSRITGLTEHLLHTGGSQPESTIKHIYLIGFGTETCNIATCLLLNGLHVTLHHQRSDKVKHTLAQIRLLLITGNDTPDTSKLQNVMSHLSHDETGTIIGKADLILVTDNLNLADSQELFAELEEKTRPEAILAIHPNTIPLNNISSALLNPERMLGIHFCHPHAPKEGIPLAEFAFSERTNRQLLNRVQLFLRQTGYMTLAMPANPGQLVNRILLHYVLQGIRLHQQGVPQAYIDRAGQHCGMVEGPLELADRLGLDDCLRLAEALQKTKHNIEIPYSLHDRVRAGTLGIKSGSGFYRYRNGNRLKTERTQWQGSEQALQEKLLGQICEEAAICLEEGLLDSPDLIDAGIIFGAGFAPYPGGPLYQQRNAA